MNVSSGQFPSSICAPALPPSKLMWGPLLPMERHFQDTSIVERGNNSDPVGKRGSQIQVYEINSTLELLACRGGKRVEVHDLNFRVVTLSNLDFCTYCHV